MTTTTEAPATMAEGSTSHTQNQTDAPSGARLSAQQIHFLLSGISGNRIGKDGKGFAHVEAWDIRRHLIRVFGFGGFDTDLIEARLVAQIDIPAGNKTRYTVVYQVSVKLTVKVDGIELGHWHGTAIGDATNQPGLADAHDLALKTADSQALKRAAVNMGDQFGLSLYNGGALTPVVNRSLAYMEPEKAPEPTADPPVKPEPGTRPPASEVPAAPSVDNSQHVGRLVGQAKTCWANAIALSQVLADAEKHQVADEEVDGPVGRQVLRDLLNDQITALNQATANGHNTERGAA